MYMPSWPFHEGQIQDRTTRGQRLPSMTGYGLHRNTNAQRRKDISCQIAFTIIIQVSHEDPKVRDTCLVIVGDNDSSVIGPYLTHQSFHLWHFNLTLNDVLIEMYDCR